MRRFACQQHNCNAIWQETESGGAVQRSQHVCFGFSIGKNVLNALIEHEVLKEIKDGETQSR